MALKDKRCTIISCVCVCVRSRGKVSLRSSLEPIWSAAGKRLETQPRCCRCKCELIHLSLTLITCRYIRPIRLCPTSSHLSLIWNDSSPSSQRNAWWHFATCTAHTWNGDRTRAINQVSCCAIRAAARGGRWLQSRVLIVSGCVTPQ